MSGFCRREAWRDHLAWFAAYRRRLAGKKAG